MIFRLAGANFLDEANQKGSALFDGPLSVEFTKFVDSLTKQLCGFLALEHSVRAISGKLFQNLF